RGRGVSSRCRVSSPPRGGAVVTSPALCLSVSPRAPVSAARAAVSRPSTTLLPAVCPRPAPLPLHYASSPPYCLSNSDMSSKKVSGNSSGKKSKKKQRRHKKATERETAGAPEARSPSIDSQSGYVP
ncbi:hypothetical protein GDO81_029678, partial [Engystomops pustulosus]